MKPLSEYGPMERLLTAKDIADMIGVNHKTVHTWVSQRKIPHLKIGRTVRFDQGDIEQWLQDRRIEPSPGSKAQIIETTFTRRRLQMRSKKIARNC